MPSVNFCISWPDGTEEACYSPSTVINEHFKTGESMPVNEFIQRAEKALHQASARVAERFGYPCSQASGQLVRLQTQAKRFDADGGSVTIMSMGNLR
ncbi:MAG: MSMEG_0570 family nitrogen starvation response protein [Pseudomonadota bacterium]